MKMLNEVIKALECCDNGEPDSNCEECSYIGIRFCCLERKNDALHYLKEYKDYQDTMCALPDYYEWVHSADNLPLTWNELREMEGKPVWIEADNGQEKFKHWFIIDEFTVSDIPGIQIMWCLYNSFRFWEADLGKTWQAYRKERDETN